MSKIKAINKGYTFEVRTWENDADNWQTNFKTLDTLEECKEIVELLKLCVSKSNQPKGVIKLGNTYGNFSEQQKEVIADFFTHNTLLLNKGLEEPEEFTQQELFLQAAGFFQEVMGELLGSSQDDYACRVVASWKITYSPEDIYLEEIVIK